MSAEIFVMEGLFLTIAGIAGFSLVMGMGGLIAWALGFDINEPEYYDHKERQEK